MDSTFELVEKKKKKF